jgi:uncharacterized protein YbjT (DUF2867 family)
MSTKLITVFGGSGFIGRYAVRSLCKAGFRVRVAMRRPHIGGDLRLAGDVGQVQLVQANVRNRASVARAVEGAYGVVNLVGLLYEKGKQRFETTHAQGAMTLAEAARAAGVERFVQMSAIGADKDSDAAYARTKAEAEEAVRAIYPEAVILRPSVVFGPEDDFINRFAQMARMSPFLPLIGGGHTRFQPVFVADVGDAVAAALTQTDAAGKTYELVGPNTYTFKEILSFITREIDRARLLVPLPFFAAKLMGTGLDLAFRLWPFSGPPLTAGQVEMLKTDNVAAPGALGLADLGVSPIETLEAIAPRYLVRFRPYGQFHHNPSTS